MPNVCLPATPKTLNLMKNLTLTKKNPMNLKTKIRLNLYY